VVFFYQKIKFFQWKKPLEVRVKLRKNVCCCHIHKRIYKTPWAKTFCLNNNQKFVSQVIEIIYILRGLFGGVFRILKKLFGGGV